MAHKPEIMTTEEARKKAFAIALAIQKNNPEWSAHREIENQEYIFLTHKTGAKAMIEYPYSPTKGAKFTGGFRTGGGQDYSTGPRLVVGVSIERSPEEAARDFERRLLPAVLEKWKTHLDGKKREEDYKTKLRATVVSVAEAAGSKPPEGERTDFRISRGSDLGLVAVIEVHNPTSIKIDIRYAPLDIAEKILTLIKGAL